MQIPSQNYPKIYLQMILDPAKLTINIAHRNHGEWRFIRLREKQINSSHAVEGKCKRYSLLLAISVTKGSFFLVFKLQQVVF